MADHPHELNLNLGQSLSLVHTPEAAKSLKSTSNPPLSLEMAPPNPPMTLAVGAPPSGAASITDQLQVAITTAQAVGAYRMVGADGLYTENTPSSLGRIAGLTLQAAGPGSKIRVVRSGPVVEAAWSWTPDMPVFISTEGVLTQVVPVSGVIRRIGWAVTPTQINIDLYPSIGV
jgi:hypothetical protein